MEYEIFKNLNKELSTKSTNGWSQIFEKVAEDTSAKNIIELQETIDTLFMHNEQVMNNFEKWAKSISIDKLKNKTLFNK